MKITVTTTTQSLDAILVQAKKDTIINNRVFDTFNVSIQNLWAVNIYAEIWEDATSANWYTILPNNEKEIKVKKLSDLNLASITSSNTDVRILID